jgi:rubrerythrin
MNRGQLEELLYQSLETERGGVRIYETAVQCAQNGDLKKEWGEYLEQTRNHEVIMLRILETFGLNSENETPGREIIRTKAQSLVDAMDVAKADPVAAQLVAAECVVEAESKDHMHWELIGEVAGTLTGEEKKTLQELTPRWRKKRTSTCTTRWDGRGSCGSSRLGSPQSFHLRRRRSTRRARSAPRERSKHGRR